MHAYLSQAGCQPSRKSGCGEVLAVWIGPHQICADTISRTSFSIIFNRLECEKPKQALDSKRRSKRRRFA